LIGVPHWDPRIRAGGAEPTGPPIGPKALNGVDRTTRRRAECAIPVHPLKHEDDGERRRFVELERERLRHHRLFVSDTLGLVDDRLSGKVACLNEKECHRQLFVATRDGQDVARCAALINERWQRRYGRENGFIGFFAAKEGVRDEVLELIGAAEEWLRERDITRVIAGCNGNALMGMGFLTDGFLESPMFPLPWTPRYYMRYLQAAGYVPSYPWWIFEVDFGLAAYQRWKKEALEVKGSEVRSGDGPWKDELEKLRKLWNRGFEGEWEMQEFSEGEFDEIYGWLDGVLDRRMLYFVHVPEREEPVGFALGFPDWTPLFRRWDGGDPDPAALKEFRFERAGVIAGAFLPEYRGKDFGGKLAATLFSYFEELGLPGALYYPANYVNVASRGLAETMGGKGRILYHCYDKRLRRGT
jgi:GNAT superfamily N-acetyltransferase